MKKVFKGLTGCVLAAGILTTNLALPVSAEQIISDSMITNIVCPSNDDPDFPFDIDIDVAKNSINYIYLDEPIYGFDHILNDDLLDVSMVFSLKEDYLDYDWYDLQILNPDYSSEIFSDSAEKDQSISISGISVGKTYKFNADLNSCSVSSEFVGEFTIQSELDGSLSIDCFYQQSLCEGGITTYTAPNDENDVYSGLQNGVSTVGTLPDANDEDSFWFDVPQSVPGGVVNLDISLSVPSGISISMEISCAKNNYYKKITSKVGKGIFLRIPIAYMGARYNITLKRNSGSSSGKYYLTLNQDIGNAWYGQFVSTIGSVDYWNPNKLDSLKLTCGGVTKTVFKQGAEKYTNWMDTSCGIVSAAMILRNLGKTMNGYDFRTNYSGDMMADPFTVMLANCESNGIGMNQNSKSLSANASRTPDDFNRFIIGNAFGVNNERKENLSETSLKNMVNTYKYVMVYFGSHWMVITGYNASGSSFNQRFIVCDPAAKSVATGYNVPLAKTTSGYSNMTVGDITSAVAFY